MEEGLTGDEALRRIAELRRGTPDGRFRSPESDDQCQYVSGFSVSVALLFE